MVVGADGSKKNEKWEIGDRGGWGKEAREYRSVADDETGPLKTPDKPQKPRVGDVSPRVHEKGSLAKPRFLRIFQKGLKAGHLPAFKVGRDVAWHAVSGYRREDEGSL